MKNVSKLKRASNNEYVSNVEWKGSQMLKESQITIKVSNVRQRVSNAEKGFK